jgi:putative SbcD/Mre11-related phosphoesterase
MRMKVHDDWLLTPERAAVHLPSATAVIADLHLGYDQARRRTGEAVPLFNLTQALAPLRNLLIREAVQRIVIAGDLFEDGWSATLAAELLTWCSAAGVELRGFVPGNHDRRIPGESVSLPVCRDGVELGGWRVVHGDGDLPEGRLVHGHFHPWLRRGRVSAPCYLVGESSLVLPAFSVDALGVNVLRQRGWQRHRCFAIAGNDVLDCGRIEALQTQPSPKR